MSKIASITLAAVLAFVAPAHAGGATKNTPPNILELCTVSGEVAGAIMRNRLAGVPLSTMMAKIDGIEDGPVKDVGKALILAAYDEPAYQTEEHKTRAITEFTNDASLACFKSMK